MAHIFKTTNLITGRFYIGQSILDRTRYYGSGKILKQSILKYGKNNLKTSKKVEQLDTTGKRLNIFNSIQEAADKIYSDRPGLSNYLNSNKAELGKTYKGFIYKIVK